MPVLFEFCRDTLGQILEQETFIHDDYSNNIPQMRGQGKCQVLLFCFRGRVTMLMAISTISCFDVTLALTLALHASLM